MSYALFFNNRPIDCINHFYDDLIDSDKFLQQVAPGPGLMTTSPTTFLQVMDGQLGQSGVSARLCVMGCGPEHDFVFQVPLIALMKTLNLKHVTDLELAVTVLTLTLQLSQVVEYL